MTPLTFQIDPQPGESARACTALARCVISPVRGTLLLFGLWAAVGVAAYFLTPETTAPTLLIGIIAVYAAMYGLQAIGRSHVRRLQRADPHAAETYYVELSDTGVRTWCSHVDARYPWAEFSQVTEDNEFYMFVRASGTGVALPKRVLDDLANVELRERLRGWSPDGGANLARELHPASATRVPA